MKKIAAATIFCTIVLLVGLFSARHGESLGGMHAECKFVCGADTVYACEHTKVICLKLSSGEIRGVERALSK